MKKNDQFNIMVVLGVVLFALLAYNQVQLMKFTGGATGVMAVRDGGKDLSNVDLSAIKSTGHSIAALFPVESISTPQEALDMIIPTGTPDYGEALGISYDDPLEGLNKLVQVYRQVQLTGAIKERYVGLVTMPVGISCEYCCGLGAIGADANGNSLCGCQHNPALLGLTKWLMQNTDYTDAEITREALKWKALFFPKDMVELTYSIAGGDTSALDKLPGMVGGC